MRLSSVQFFNAVIMSLADLGNDQLFDEIEACKTSHGSLEPLVRRPPVAPVEPEVLAPSKADDSKGNQFGFSTLQVELLGEEERKTGRNPCSDHRFQCKKREMCFPSQNKGKV